MPGEGRIILGIIGVAGLFLSGGCRTATRVQEVPRVDLGLSKEGNRGYVMGSPPSAPDMKTTRQIVQTDIEIPSFYKPKPSSKQLPPQGFWESTSPADSEVISEGTGPYDTYMVRKGESLWSIAARPEIYGKAGMWKKIFEANRDLLKDPHQLKVGMTLKIPREASQQVSEASGGEEAPTYHK